jgi:hypothetical protein
LLSNYNIKYTCTIYTRLDICIMSISRFSLWDKVTLQLLKFHFYGADVVEWFKPNSVRIIFLSCQIYILLLTGFELTPLIHCSTNRFALLPAPYTTRPHPLHKNGTSIVEVFLVSQVTLISSGTDIVWGCHLLICSYNILYFLWLYNELFIILYNILRNCCARLLSNYNIKYACTIYIRLDTCFMSISVSSLRDKVTLRLLKLHFYGADVVEWSKWIIHYTVTGNKVYYKNI